MTPLFTKKLLQIFLDFAEQNVKIFSANPNHYSTTSFKHVSILTLGGF